MRIVHIVRRFDPLLGGIERYVHGVATGQVLLGHEVTVVTLDRDVIHDRAGRLPARERIQGVDVVRLAGFGNRRYALCLRPDQMVRVLRSADVIHQHDLRFMTGLVAMTASATGRPLIVHTHGLIFHTPWAGRLKRQTFRRYYGPLLRATATRIIASSEPDREVLLEHAPYLESRTVVFENATDLEPFLQLERRPQPGLIVTPGRLSRHKGLEDLLRATAQLEPGAWTLELSGPHDREERARLQGIVAELGIGDRVNFTGIYTDQQHLERLQRAAMCVFPSEHEGFGFALLEGMAAGVPLLARDIPAHRSVLGPDLTDRLVRIQRPADLALAIERQLSETAAQDGVLSTRLRRRSLDFDIGRLLRQLEELYSLLHPARAHAGGSS